MAPSALALVDVDAFYGDSHVLHKISFALGEGRLLGLLGRNGAGKSTCMNVAVGLLPARGGEIEVFGKPVTNASPEAIAGRGVALVPQGRRVFRSLTVRENLAVAAARPAGGGGEPWTADRVFAMFPRLGERRQQLAASLSGGEQQMLAIGRALMRNPRVLLMDEPSEGLAPLLVKTIFQAIREVNQKAGVTVLLVEQNARAALKLAHRGYVMEVGHIVLHDTAPALAADPKVQSAYLGGRAA
ncbi:MAG: ABC transporter ATP-binding protein [Microvirga sp.]